MSNEIIKDVKEICDDLLHEVKGMNKLDLLFGSVHAAHNDGYLYDEQRDALYNHLEKTANICNIETKRDIFGMPVVKRR